jgi:hypothetical protein
LWGARAYDSVMIMTSSSTQPDRAEEPMRHTDLHESDPRLPQACIGAVLALMLLVAAFVSIPASAAEPPVRVAGAPLER